MGKEVMTKTHMFAPDERRLVEIWVVAAYHRNLLYTDDSFQFARAMRQIHTHFAVRVKAGVDDNVAHDDHDIQVVLADCLTLGLSMFHLRWTRVPVSKMFQLATSGRMSFEPSLRVKIDAWATEVHRLRNDPGKHSTAWVAEDYLNQCHPLRKKVKLSNTVRRTKALIHALDKPLAIADATQSKSS